MSTVAAVLSRLGVADLSELRRAGITARAIQRSCEAGEIIRIRRGVYASAAVDARILLALRVGGSLTCISGTAFHGMWQPEGAGLHVGVLNRASRLVHPGSGVALGAGFTADLVVHWSAPVGPVACRGILPVVDCLLEVIRCQPEDIAFAVLESALRGRHLSAQQQARLEFAVSSKKRFLVRHARGSADSGSESLFRYRMLRLGILMRSQVEIPGVGRVDFVIGDRLLIEIDSNAHHGGIAKRLRDLHRDAIAAGLGFITLRFDYDQILHDWETVEATVLAIISRGEHLSARR